MRSTLYVAPASSDMLKSSQIPFAVAVTPFARLHSNEVSYYIISLAFDRLILRDEQKFKL